MIETVERCSECGEIARMLHPCPREECEGHLIHRWDETCCQECFKCEICGEWFSSDESNNDDYTCVKCAEEKDVGEVSDV